MVVILSPKVAYEADKMLVDKETILCSLNIKAMTFEELDDSPDAASALPNASSSDIDVIERRKYSFVIVCHPFYSILLNCYSTSQC